MHKLRKNVVSNNLMENIWSSINLSKLSLGKGLEITKVLNMSVPKIQL